MRLEPFKQAAFWSSPEPSSGWAHCCHARPERACTLASESGVHRGRLLDSRSLRHSQQPRGSVVLCCLILPADTSASGGRKLQESCKGEESGWREQVAAIITVFYMPAVASYSISTQLCNLINKVRCCRVGQHPPPQRIASACCKGAPSCKQALSYAVQCVPAAGGGLKKARCNKHGFHCSS